MSTDSTSRDPGEARSIHYEVRATGEVVTLTFQDEGREFSLATDTQSARLMALDIAKAAQHSMDDSETDENGFVHDGSPK
jgi:hypothetical protein